MLNLKGFCILLVSWVQEVECAKAFLKGREEIRLNQRYKHLRWPQVCRCGCACQECVGLIPRIWYAFPLTFCVHCAEGSCLCTQLPALFLFFNPLSSSSWSLPVPVCLWLIASPSMPLLCLPPTACAPIILRVSSRPGGDFNSCCNFLFSSSIICCPPHLELNLICTAAAKVMTLTLEEQRCIVEACWAAFSAEHTGTWLVTRCSDVSGVPAHYTL